MDIISNNSYRRGNNFSDIKIDPCYESQHNLLAITFPRSKASSYELAVNIASQAAHYCEATTPQGQLYHIAVFAKDQADATRAQIVLGYIGSIKGLQVFAGGKLLQETYKLMDVLSCYLSSLVCDDWKAHCFTMVGDAVYPCTYLWQHYRSFPVENHPSTPENQIQANAVRLGCSWCPRFDSNNFRKV